MRVLAIALTAVLVVVSVAAIVGGFAVLARRLLGLRFGMVRLLLAGLIGFAVAGPIARALIEPAAGGTVTPLWFALLAGAAALVVAMVFLVVAEALAPSGSLPGPLELRRLLRGRVARARRYSQISRILVRHGLGPYLQGRRRAELATPEGRERLAGSVRQALEEAGVTFVKLGQVLSTRPDLLPPQVVEELGRLQDDVAPAAWDEVSRALTEELGEPVEKVFAAFDRTPLAAASVAQVHAARLHSGDEVVVKVQRPGIRAPEPGGPHRLGPLDRRPRPGRRLRRGRPRGARLPHRGRQHGRGRRRGRRHGQDPPPPPAPVRPAGCWSWNGWTGRR